MSTCVEKLPHEECGSSDALQVFVDNEDNYTGYCFACDTYVPSPYGDDGPSEVPSVPERSPEDVRKELEEISILPAVDLDDRKLQKGTLEYFGVTVGLSEADGKTPVFRYYPYTSQGETQAYKVKLPTPDGKKMWSVGSMERVNLFGWEQALTAGAPRLFITEGEDDAMALFQVLKAKNRGTKWEKYDPSVVSLTRGSQYAVRDITAHAALIRSTFKEVVLVFDNDEAGRKATERVLREVLPTAKTIDIPGKDANDCLLNGRSKALASAALFRSTAPKNTRIVLGDSLFTEARKEPEFGLSWPWEHMTELTRGMRFGETYYLGAGVKMGKSEVVNTLAVHMMTVHNMPVFLAKPEEANVKTVRMLAGKVNGHFFHDPNIPFDFEAYDEATKALAGKVHMLSLYQHMGWNTLQNDIRDAVRQGCRAVFIDPITNLINGVASGEANTALQEISQELAAMAKDLDIIVWIFCHLKAPDGGPAHERGGKVLSHQFAGSRAMMRSCNYMFGLEGNKDPDLTEEQRNMRRLVILEDREFGASGYSNLYWDNKTSLFNEVKV